jgi:hypothetical protein
MSSAGLRRASEQLSCRLHLRDAQSHISVPSLDALLFCLMQCGNVAAVSTCEANAQRWVAPLSDGRRTL